jgi:hypothetical protein
MGDDPDVFGDGRDRSVSHEKTAAGLIELLS